MNGDSISERSEKVWIKISGLTGTTHIVNHEPFENTYGWIDDDDEFTYSMSANTQGNTRSVREGSDNLGSLHLVPLYLHSNRQHYNNDGWCHAGGGTATPSSQWRIQGRVGDYKTFQSTVLDDNNLDHHGVLDDTTGIQRCQIGIFRDDIIEEDETVELNYQNPALGIGPSNAVPMGTLTIRNDDHELSIDAPGVDEGDTGTGELEFAVTLNPPSVGQVTVDYATGDGSAASGGAAREGGDDYEPRQGTLTFEAGETSATIPVTVNGDTTWEGDDDETVEVTLSNPVGPDDSTVAHPTDAAVGTIRQDDALPTASVAAPPAAVPEGGDLVFPVTLSNPSYQEAAVAYSLAGTATKGADYTDGGSGTVTFAAGDTQRSISLATVADTDDEEDETVEVTLADADDPAYDLGTSSTATGTIADDDMPALSIGDATVTEGDAGESATLTFTVTLTPPATLPVTVDWETADGTAQAGTDYTAANGTLRFDTGDETRTVTVTVTGDDADEPNETLTVTLSNAPGATLEDATATGTITDDDGPPALTLVLTPASIGEDGGKSTVTATLDRASSAATTLTVTAVPVDPAVANDYTLAGSQLTIPADSLTSTGEVTITAVDNDVDALDKEVTVSATATNAQGVTAPDDAILTITDDDAPALSIGDASVAEGDADESATLTFTVTLTPAATLPVTVDWKTADGTAEAGTDYTAGNGTLRFETGDESKTVTVTVTGDDADEPNETLTVTLSNAPGATLSDATGTGTITDDDDAPTVTLVLTPASIGEDGGKSTVTATLDRPSSAATTVTVTSVPVSPAVAGDYTLAGSQLTIAAGETTSTGTVTITATDNDVDALDKTVTVSATATNSQGITAPQDATLTIADDDAPSLSVADASVAEGDEGETATLTFTVTLTPAATLPVEVDWKTADGTATAGTDYTASNGTLRFETGDETKTVTVTVTGDDVYERNETLTVTLSNAPGATLGKARAIGTITDDDGPPALTLVLTPDSITENGGTSTVTATLDRPSGEATTVAVSATPVSPAVAGDYTLSTNTTLTIPADSLTSTGTVTITAVDNAVDAPDKEVAVSATVESTLGVTAPQDATLTITDDETPVVTVAVETATVTEGKDAAFTLTRTGDLSGELAVTFGVTGGGAVLTDAPPTGATFGANAATVRVALSTDDDQRDEPDATLTLALTDGDDYDLGTSSEAEVTVEDNDDAPAVTLVLTPASIGEDGGKSTVTATLDRPSSEETTVTVSAEAVSPAVAGDYTLSTNTTLTIAAGETTSTGDVTITAVNNDVDAPDKTVTVSATAANTQGITAPQDATLTITDDDAPALSIADASVAEGDEGETATLTFTVTLTPAATLPVTADWATSDGTAEAGTDYTAANGTLTFETGDGTRTVTVTVTGDDADEPNETLTVTLSNAPGATITDATGTGTITDDDDAPTVTLVLTPPSISENGGKSTVTATLDHPSSAATTVTVSAAPVSPALAGDYTLSTNTTLTIAAGQTTSTGAVTITAANNTVYEGDKTVSVSATATNTQGVTGPQDVTLTITEDDTAPVVTVAAETATITEGEDAVFILTRASADITTPLDVDFTVADPNTVLDQAAPTTATIPADQTTVKVTLATDDDAAHEADATLTLTVTDGDIYNLGSESSAAVTVEDNDPPGRVSAADAAVTVAADDAAITEGGDAMFTLTRTGSASEQLVVTIAVTGGGEVLADEPPTEATFGTGAATTQVALATDDDEVDEADATLMLTVTDGDDYYPGDPAEAEITVEDDDDTPEVTLVLTPPSIGENGGKSTVTASLDRASSEATTVTVSATPVSPALASDYTLSTNTTLTIAAGQTTSTGAVTITAVNNDVDNLDREVAVSATAANSQGITAPDNVTLTIEDDDAPALSIADASVDEGDEGDSPTLTFTVTLSPAATLPVTVDWETADGTAEAGTDYTAGNGTLTFNTGDATKTVTVTVTGDDADEPNETLTVTLSNESGATLSDATGTGTITDDDDAPTVALVLTPASITENGGRSTVTATLDRPSSEETTVTVSAAPVSPAVADDYALSANTALTIAAGQTASTGVVTITAVNNNVDAADKTVTVSATAANDQGITAPDNVILTIEDDDAPSLSIADASVAEGDQGETATLTFTVTLDPAATLPVTVDWATSDGTATAGTDYAAANGTLRFDTGDETKTVTVTVTGDDADEPNETLTVTLSNAPGATLSDATGTGTITDDDDAPTVALVLTPDSITENGGKSTVTATLDRPSSEETTVTVSAAPVSPAVADDYALSANKTLTIAAGQTASTGVVTITAVNNDVDAADKTVTVSATAANAQGITAPDDATLTIEDDDAPSLSVADASVAEGDQGTTATLTFTVTLDPAATLPVTVDWKTSDGTAEAGTDYTAGNGTLTFNTGDETKTITVTVAGDDADEPNETLTVTLSNAPGATLADATATGTITDDDGPPAVTLVLTPATIGEDGGKSTLTATLDRPSSEETTVTVSAAPVSPAVADDYALSANKTLTIAAGQTASTGVVTITAVDNSVDALDKTVTVSATAANAQGITAPDDATLTIEDDDAPSLSVADASVDEGNAGTTATLTFTVTLDPAATLPVTVDWATSDGTATAGTDYTAANGTLRFDTGDETKTVTVTVTGDDADEPNETFTVTLSNESGATLGDATGTGTITDDDGPPAVALVLTPTSIGEDGGKSTVTATLDRASSEETTVTVSAAPVSPALAGDYTLSTNTTLTIAAGETTSTGEVTITAVNNNVDALDKTVTVSATAANGQGITAPDDATLTITDDDAPSLSITDASVAEGNAGTSATLTFTVTLDPAATLPVTVDWKTSDGTAEAGTDYTAGNGTLTFNTGDATKTVTVTVTGDDADEPNETLTVTLSNESGATLGDATGTGTVTDDDGPPAVALVLTPATIGEDGGKSTVTATLDRPSSEETTVTVSATPVSPALAGDYSLSANKTLTIASGSTTSTGVVTITAVNNDVDAADKTVTVSATAANAQGITAPDDATLTITDDDAPSLSVADASVAEGNAGTSATLTFTVTLSPAATLPVTADWATSDGTATAGTDYTAGNGTLIFETGDETKTVTVTVTGDDADEPNETFTVTLSNESGATLGDATGTGTITDDDDAPAVTLVLTPASITEDGGKSTVTATLDRPSSEETTVTVSAAPVSPALAGDYTLGTNTTLTIAAGETTSTGTVTITAVDNSVDALDKTVTVSATAANAQGITAPDDATLTIEDDDAPALSVADASVAEGNQGTTATLTFTVTLTPAATLPVTADWATSDGTAEAGTDYAAANGTLTFETGDETKTVTVTVTGDDVDEPNETLTVTLSNESGATLSDATATGTITDDEDDPSLAVADASAPESADLVFPLTLDPPSSEQVAVRYAITADTAQEADYTGTTTGTVTFAPGETSKDVVLDLVDDSEDEVDETVTLTLSGLVTAGNAAIGDATATGTIEDDDEQLVTVAAETAEVTEGADAVFALTRTGLTAEALDVTFAVTGGGSVLAADAPTSATIPAGKTTVEVALATADDDTDEPDATLTLALGDGDGYGPGASSNAMLTVRDNDGTPALTVADASAPESADLVFALSLSPASSGEVTVQYDIEADTAQAEDYTGATSGTVKFAPGETTKDVALDLVDDAIDEVDETVTLTLSGLTGTASLADGTAKGTIEDNDLPLVTVAAGEDVTEGEDVVFTLTRAGLAAEALDVAFAVSGGAAVLSAPAPTQATFGAGETTVAVTLATEDDGADEPNATLTLTLTDGGDYDLGTASEASVTVEDNDSADGAQGGIASVTVVADGDVTEGAEAVFVLTRTVSTSNELTVAFAVAGGGAVLSGAPPTEATFAADAATVRVALATEDDNTDEPNAALTLTLAAGDGYELGEPSAATLAVADNDGTPALRVADAAAPESADLEFPLTLNPASWQEVTVRYEIAPETAQPADYAGATSGTVTFAPGETSASAVLELVDDAESEPDETVTLALAGLTGTAELADGTARGTIRDDDAAVVTVASATITDGGALVFVLKRTGNLSVAQTIRYRTEYTGQGVILREGYRTFAVGASALEMRDPEFRDATVTAGVRTAKLTLLAPDEHAVGYTVGEPSEASVTVEGYHVPVVTVTAAGAVAEGAPAVFEVARAGDRSEALEVFFAVEDAGGALTAAPPGSVVVAAGEAVARVALATVDDEVDEADAVVTLSLVDRGYYALGEPARAAVTVRDDDGVPTVYFAETAASVLEGGTLEFPVRLSNATGVAVPVRYRLGGTADAADYEDAGNGALAFAPGETERTIRLATVDDEVDEADETVVVELEAPAAELATLGVFRAQGAIRDDDLPVVSVAAVAARVSEGEDAVFRLTRAGDLSVALKVAYRTDYSGGEFGAGVQTFLAGRETLEFRWTIKDDAEAQGDRTAKLTLLPPDRHTSEYVVGEPSAATVTVVDDDGAEAHGSVPGPVSVAAETDAVAEGEDAVFVLARTGDASAALSVRFTVEDPAGALAGPVPGRAVFGANESTARVALATQDDGTDEADAEVRLTLAGAADADSPARASVTVRDDEEAPTASVENAGTAAEGGVLSFPVRLSHPSARGIAVDYVLGGTATAGDDYAGAAAGAVTFAPGETSAEIALALAADGADEADETVEVALSAVRGPAELAGGAAVGTIADGDLPTVTVAAESAAVAAGGAAVFVLTRAGYAGAALTAAVEVSERGGDMVPAAREGARRAMFAAGVATARLRVATAGTGSGSRVTVAVAPMDGSYEVGRPDSATVAVAASAPASVLAQGRRDGAASLLRSHARRFSGLTSEVALRRLGEGRAPPVETVAEDPEAVPDAAPRAVLLSVWQRNGGSTAAAGDDDGGGRGGGGGRGRFGRQSAARLAGRSRSGRVAVVRGRPRVLGGRRLRRRLDRAERRRGDRPGVVTGRPRGGGCRRRLVRRCRVPRDIAGRVGGRYVVGADEPRGFGERRGGCRPVRDGFRSGAAPRRRPRGRRRPRRRRDEGRWRRGDRRAAAVGRPRRLGSRCPRRRRRDRGERRGGGGPALRLEGLGHCGAAFPAGRFGGRRDVGRVRGRGPSRRGRPRGLRRGGRLRARAGDGRRRAAGVAACAARGLRRAPPGRRGDLGRCRGLGPGAGRAVAGGRRGSARGLVPFGAVRRARGRDGALRLGCRRTAHRATDRRAVRGGASRVVPGRRGWRGTGGAAAAGASGPGAEADLAPGERRRARRHAREPGRTRPRACGGRRGVGFARAGAQVAVRRTGVAGRDRRLRRPRPRRVLIDLGRSDLRAAVLNGADGIRGRRGCRTRMPRQDVNPGSYPPRRRPVPEAARLAGPGGQRHRFSR